MTTHDGDTTRPRAINSPRLTQRGITTEDRRPHKRTERGAMFSGECFPYPPSPPEMHTRCPMPHGGNVGGVVEFCECVPCITAEVLTGA